jgi:putative peptidoglycan lipid II flippase
MIFKSSIIVIIIGFLSRILGFAREVLLGNYFGASADTDIYLFSIMIPTIIFDVVGAAIAATFIPMYLEAKSKSVEEAHNYTNAIIVLILIFAGITMILGVVFSPLLVKLFAPEFTGAKLLEAIRMMRLAFPLTIFLGVVYVFSAFLQAHRIFIPPASIGIPYNIILISGTIFSFYYWGITGLVMSHILAILTQSLFLMVFVLKQGLKFKFKIKLQKETVKKIINLSLPVIIGLGVAQINILVDRSIASTLQEGSISSLYYANRVNFLFLGVFALSLISIMYPVLSDLVVKKNYEKFNEHLIKILSIIAMFTIPITVIISFWNKELIGILFQRGAFDEKDTFMTAQSLLFYVIGLTALAWKEVISKAFYSLGNTKTPMYNAIIAVIINILLSVILSRYMNYAGLALATSISSLVSVFLLFFKYSVHYSNVDNFRLLFISVSKYIITSGVLGAILFIVLRCIIDFGNPNKLSMTIIMLGLMIVGFIVYILILYILKVEEVKSFFILIKGKFSSRI